MMAAMDRTAAAVRTLQRVDPDFVAMVKDLYGDVGVEQIVEEISKLAPSPSDVSTPSGPTRRQKISRDAAFAGVAAGGLLGAKELVNEVPNLGGPVGRAAGTVRSATQKVGGRLVPAGVLNAAKSPKGKVAVATTALGADALATNELKPSKNQQGGVNKIGLRRIPSVTDMVAGIRTKSQGIVGSLIPQPVEPVPGVAAGSAKSSKAAQGTKQFTQGLLTAGTSGPGKTLAAGGLVTAGVKRHNSKVAAQAPGPDDQSAQLGKSIEWAGEISKVDADKRLVFGWASVVKVNGIPVTDHQDDVIDENDLEDAAYHYVLNSRVGGHMHRRIGKDFFGADAPHHISDLVESMVFTDEKVKAMGLPDDFPRGWWTGYKVNDEAAWEDVKKGKLRSFSIHGRGKRTEIPLDTMMGW